MGAAVYPSQQVFPPRAIQDFLANPSNLLPQYPNGGKDMIKAVQDLAASDPVTLSALAGTSFIPRSPGTIAPVSVSRSSP
jgi:hypothetical protein